MLGRIYALIVTLTLLGTTGSAHAAPLVIYGAGLDSAQAAVAAKAILGTGNFKVQGSLADLAGGSPGAPLVVGAPQTLCNDPSAELLSRVVGRARVQVTDLEYAAASLHSYCFAHGCPPDTRNV